VTTLSSKHGALSELFIDPSVIDLKIQIMPI
jgi:hypothetical protein